jgi:hypothetical protein
MRLWVSLLRFPASAGRAFILLGYDETRTQASKVYAICYRHWHTDCPHTLAQLLSELEESREDEDS